MAKTAVMLGIDIGGTTTSLGYVRRDGICLAETTIATNSAEPAARLIQRIDQEVRTTLTTQAPDCSPQGLGIGAPNANYHTGVVEKPPNLNWGLATNLAELFRHQFALPAVITNDANAAALGELHFGAGRGLRHFIAITLGTGLGSGIVVNGALLYGATGHAGELGHTIVETEGRHCACGKRGCLETYVSAGGLCRTVFSLLAEQTADSVLRAVSFHELTARTVYEAAHAGDEIARTAFAITGRILGMKLADAVAITSPEAFIVSGGLAAAGELLLEPTRNSLEEHLLDLFRGTVRLLPSGLPTGSGAVIGAAALAWSELADF
jgi:glucokinase